MLELTLNDLARASVPGATPGVRVWWIPLPRRKTPALVLAFTDLVLIAPRLTWPDRVHPEREPGWGEDSFRFTWVRQMGRLVSLRGVPTMNLAPFLGLGRHGLTKLRVARRRRIDGFAVRPLVRRDGSEVYATALALQRTRDALEVGVGQLDLRTTERCWSGKRVAFAYFRRRLRAVVTTSTEEALRR